MSQVLKNQRLYQQTHVGVEKGRKAFPDKIKHVHRFLVSISEAWKGHGVKQREEKAVTRAEGTMVRLVCAAGILICQTVEFQFCPVSTHKAKVTR